MGSVFDFGSFADRRHAKRGAFYGGFLACLAAGYFWGERAAVWSMAFVIVAPVCLIVFVISYMFNEKKA